MEHAADAAIEREFAAANRINGDAGGVRRIFHRKLHVQFHRDVAEETAFHPDKRNLVVELPRNVIARADVNVFVGETLVR